MALAQMEFALVFNNLFFRINLLILIEIETKEEISTIAHNHNGKSVEELGTLSNHVGIDLINNLLLSLIKEDKLILINPLIHQTCYSINPNNLILNNLTFLNKHL